VQTSSTALLQRLLEQLHDLLHRRRFLHQLQSAEVDRQLPPAQQLHHHQDLHPREVLLRGIAQSGQPVVFELVEGDLRVERGKRAVTQIAGHSLSYIWPLLRNGADDAVEIALKDLAELRQQSIDDIEGLGEFLSGGEGGPVRVVDDIFLGFSPGLEGGEL